MAAKPAIAFITERPGPWSFGRVAAALGKGFGELGDRLDLVYLKGLYGSKVNGRIRSLGLGEIRARAALRRLTAYLHAAAPPLTLVSPLHIAPTAMVAGKLSGQVVVPWVPTMVELESKERAFPINLLPALQSMYRFSPGVAVVATDVAEQLRQHYGSALAHKLHVLPNPVDIDHVTARSREVSPVQLSAFTLCTAGTLERVKGIDVLLRALAECGPAMPDPWSLLVLGEGPWRPLLQTMAGQMGLHGRVRFLGHVENPYPIMNRADIFVHPSRFEGCPVALLEALCLGRPIIATSCPGGPAEILGYGEFGWLVPPEDPASLARALVRLTANPDERMRLGLRASARSHTYSPHKIAGTILDIARAVNLPSAASGE